jgi:hypothetical protein
MWGVGAAAVALFFLSGFICAGFSVPIGSPRGSGKLGTETRPVEGVREVELASLGNLYVELGEREELRIEADDNLLRYVETDVDGDTLVIRHRRGTALRTRLPIEYYLTVESLDAVLVSGAGNVVLPELSAETFKVEITGAGSIDLEELYADSLQVRIGGAGDFEVQGGQVDEQEISITGAGDYRARDLDSETAQVNLSGLGSATLLVRERLDVTITGAGSVRYLGRPSVQENVTGLGSVEAIGE